MQQELSIEECFRILELEPGATLVQVRESWRTLSQIWHPDKHPQGTKAHELAANRQLMINLAHDVLKNYLGSNAQSQPLALGQNLESRVLEALAEANRIGFRATTITSEYPRMNQSEFNLCMEAANAGDLNAQFKTGLALELGFTGPIDAKGAAYWYDRASRRGQAAATHRLGFLYLYGIGVSQDAQKGIKLWMSAAVQGSTDAQLDLGLAYEVGAQVRANAGDSAKWYEMAKKTGTRTAESRKVVGMPVSRSYQRA